MKSELQSTEEPKLEQLRPVLLGTAIAITRDSGAAEDLVQRTYQRALESSVDITRLDNPVAWMRAVMRNIFIDGKRRQARGAELLETQVPQQTVVHPLGGLRADLERGLAAIPADMAQALVLVAVYGYTYQEVADIQECAVGTAKSRVARARVALVKVLGRDAKPNRSGEGGES